MTGRRKTTTRRGLPCVPVGQPPPRGDHVLTVPGAEAPIMPVDIPDGVRGASRLRVARQQIADRLGLAATSIAVMPFGQRKAWSRVIVVDASRLEGWVTGAGKGCRAIRPDYLCLPEAARVLFLAISGDYILARIGTEDGFAAPLGSASLLLRRALEGAGLEQAAIGPHVPQRITAIVESAGLSTEAAAVDVSTAPAKGVDLRDALAAEADSSGMGVWYAAAAVAVLAFTLWATGVIVETRAIERELAEVRARTEAVLREGLLPSEPLLDVRAQVDRAFAQVPEQEARDDLARLDLLSRVSVLVFGRGLEVEQISLDASGLGLSISAADFSAAEALESELRSEGLTVETDVMRARGDGRIEARLRVLVEGRE